MINKLIALCNNCSCGQKHTLLTDTCVVSESASEMMKEYITKHGYKNVAIVCDENTVNYAHFLSSVIGTNNIFVLPGNSHATEIYTALTDEHFESSKPDCAIACGSGSVHDIVRFSSHAVKIPFISYPTAASVDGFVSGVAAMTWYGQKLTYPSTPPVAVFACPSVFSDAPERLTASGAGDVFGKYTSLFDWQVGEILTGEHYCDEIANLEYEALSNLISAVNRRDEISKTEYTVCVMNALLLSGLAMQLMGNSRPASGSEHHMSHLWEMHCINEDIDALHGEKVAVGLCHVLHKYSETLKKAQNGEFVFRKPDNLDKFFSVSELEPVYGSLTGGIIKENNGTLLSEIKIDDTTTSKMIEKFKLIPPENELISIMKKADIPLANSEIGLPDNEDFIEKSLHYSPYVRARLTLMKVISSLEMN